MTGGRAILAVTIAAVLSGALLAQARPVVDGVLGPSEWRAARHEVLSRGGDLYFSVGDGELSLAVRGTAAGLASICLGNDHTVTVFHASAALGSSRYEKADGRWQRKTEFEFALRDSPRTGPPPAAERAAFFAKAGWLANASNSGIQPREFAIKLTPAFARLAVTYLSTNEPMVASTWPATAADDCTSVKLAQGWLTPEATFKPETWHLLQAR